VMERLLEDVSFHAAKFQGASVAIDAAFVDERLAGIAGDDELAKYIL
jgi:ATP-dependent HslUV protease ATP-binding subunit HslU